MRLVGVRGFIVFFALLAGVLLAQSPYEVTKDNFKYEDKLVHDFGNILSVVERNQLESKLIAYDDSTSVQILILTFKNLEGYPIGLLGSEIGEKWGVGQKDTHNGVVIVVSDEDRKVTIRGGYGIQAKMPPSIEQLIIDREMIPSFKNGDYYTGLDKGIDAIQKQLAGQYQAKPRSSNDGEGWVVFFVFLFIIVVFIIIASKGGGGGGSRSRRGFNWGDVIFTSGGTRTWGGGSSWGGGGSFGGGGFGGFGGGSFGGGGATGSW